MKSKTRVQRRAWRPALLLLASALMAGCQSLVGLTYSVEDRINAAFPLGEDVLGAREALVKIAGEGERGELASQMETRLKLRALSCANGYVPPAASSTSEVRAMLNNADCFAAADAGIARWLGWRRVGMSLREPPLVPIPAVAPALITGGEFIQTVSMADDAGVVLLETLQAIEVVEMASSRTVFAERKSGLVSYGSLSPNGRLFTISHDGNLRIRDSATGATVLQLPGVYAYEFHWLDAATAVYRRGHNGAVLVDFASGRELPLPRDLQVSRAVKVRDRPDQYVFFDNPRVVKVELLRGKAVLELRVLGRVQAGTPAWGGNTSGPTADGKAYVDMSRFITWVTLEDLASEEIRLEPFYVHAGSVAATPDQLIFGGFHAGGGFGGGAFVYTLGRNTITRIDTTKLPSTRFVYMTSLRKLAVIDRRRIVVLDELPLLDTVTATQFKAVALEISQGKRPPGDQR